MFKKSACYLSLLLLTAPLVATAEDSDPALVQTTLAQWVVACPDVAVGADFPTLLDLQAFYQQNAGQAVWADDERRAALQVQLQQLADDGLDPARYNLPVEGAVQATHCADIAISQRYLQALHDLRFGYLPQDRLEPVWKANPPPQDHPAVVLAIAGLGRQNLADAFEQARPNLDLYRNLRGLYARLRQQPLAEWQAVPGGPLLQPDKQDARVPALAQRLFNEGYLSTPPQVSDEHYSPMLVAAMKSFQAQHSLQADGVVGPWTVTELNISPAMRREQLRINLERMRWLAQDVETRQCPGKRGSGAVDGLPGWRASLANPHPGGACATADTVAQIPRHPADAQPDLDHSADHYARRQTARNPP